MLPRRVALPAAALAELPLAGSEDRVAQRREQSLVESAQVGVGLLVGASGEEDGQSDTASFQLAFVDEPRAGLRQRRYRGDAALLGGKVAGRARLVVVLEEADEPALVARVAVRCPRTDSAPSCSSRS